MPEENYDHHTTETTESEKKTSETVLNENEKTEIPESEKLLSKLGNIINNNQDILGKYWTPEHIINEFSKLLDDNGNHINTIKSLRIAEKLEKFIITHIEKPQKTNDNSPISLTRAPQNEDTEITQSYINSQINNLKVSDQDTSEDIYSKDLLNNQAIQDTNTIDKIKERNLEIRNFFKEAIQARSILIQNAPKESKIEENTKQWSVLYEQSKEHLQNTWVLNKLKDSDISEEEIDNIITLVATHEFIKQDPTIPQEDIWLFETAFKNFQNALNIPDISHSDFSKENISSTMNEVFNEDCWNKDLINNLYINLDSHEYQDDFFQNLTDDQMFILFSWSTGQDWKVLDAYQKLIDKHDQWKELSDKENQWMKDAKGYFEKKYASTCKNTMEKLNTMWPIIGLYNYLWWENGKDLESNMSNDFSIENWMLTIGWVIKWHNFKLRQNIEKDEPIQCLSSLKDWNSTISFNDNDFKELWWIAPSQNTLRQEFLSTFKSKQQELLNWNMNINELQKDLEDSLYETIQKQYQNKDLIEYEVESQIIKSDWIQTYTNFLKNFWNNTWDAINDISNPNKINKKNNSILFNHFKDINLFYNDASNDEAKQFNECLNKIQAVSQDLLNWKDPHENVTFESLHPSLQDFFLNKWILNSTNKILKWEEINSWETTIFDLFNLTKFNWTNIYNVDMLTALLSKNCPEAYLDKFYLQRATIEKQLDEEAAENIKDMIE